MTTDPGSRTTDLTAVAAYYSVEALDLLPGELRGYWKQHSPGKWLRQAKIHGKINNEKAILLLDTGAEVSIVDTAFARKVGCYIDRSQSQECVGIGENVYTTEGRTRIKITLAGSLVYIFDIWVGDLSEQEAILYPASEAGSTPEIRGRESVELPVRLRRSGHDKLWVTRGDLWVPTVVNGPGKTSYLQITNVGEKKLVLCRDERISMWLAGDRIPRLQGFVSVGSRRYMEWQNLALQATTDAGSTIAEPIGTLPESMVERPKYQTPRAILRRLDPACSPPAEVGPSGSRSGQVKSSLDPTQQPNTKDTVRPAGVAQLQVTPGLRSLDPDPGDDQLKVDDHQDPDPATDDSLALLNSTVDLDMSSGTQDPERAQDPAVGEETVPAVAASSGNHSETGGGPANHTSVGGKQTPESADLPVLVDGQKKQVVDSHRERGQIPDPTDSLEPGPDDATADEQVCYHESGDLHAEDVAVEMGNALPPAARGVVCDIDVGNAKPIAQRVRKMAPQLREKLSDLIKGRLGAKIISVSTSPWAPPIVVIIKKNGVDIRLCIDYRLVNSLTRLMIYPMPLINDLLDDLDKVLWYCSLDMVSGFWVVSMTYRARAISAFITPFGLFEWNRMPFGLKNAPQIYQRMLDSALYGLLGSRVLDPADLIKMDLNLMDLDPTKVESLLEACDRWNLSISVVKSFWGKSKVEYLGHQVSSSGLEANPKDLTALTDLPFPQSLRSMQSFLGSLNYYSRFIEDYAIYAAVLYELREVDFAAMSKRDNQTQIQARVARSTPDSDDPAPEQVDPRFDNLDLSPNESIDVDPRWIRAHRAFDILKERIADTPILQHFDPDKLPVIVVYASTWAISAALMQEHAGSIIRLCSPVIQVLTRHSTLAWLFRSTGLQGQLGQWAALLSPWTLEIVKCKKGEDEILGVIAASITPRTEVDLALVAIAQGKEPRRQIQTPMPTVLPDERLYVASFDGSARVKRGGGAYSAILWELPEWTVVKARSGYAEGLTANEAEYHGLLLCLDLLEGEDRRRLIICGDSNLVIRQVRGEIDWKAPGLTLLQQKTLDRLRIWPDHDLVHVKRGWHGSADRLASAALQRQAGIMVEDEADLLDLVTLNRLDEILRPEINQERSVARVMSVTTGPRAGSRLGGSGSSGSRPGGPDLMDLDLPPQPSEKN
ncbi:unnamed protein product [Phytophthora fragariaefolia]|uniref:Unnamed protein product n=1 Tax=Phytophthora fragariaefolia TaxID=1490495 RepID=A0A9W7CZZ2_9STRA|nr:unnamed protein product [Phytophthora fragariaefolia]